MNKGFDLLEFLQYILGCTYISDLRIEPYNSKAKILLDRLNCGYYTLSEITDCMEYLHETKREFTRLIGDDSSNP